MRYVLSIQIRNAYKYLFSLKDSSTHIGFSLRLRFPTYLLHNFFKNHFRTCDEFFYKEHGRLLNKVNWLSKKQISAKISKIKSIKFYTILKSNNTQIKRNMLLRSHNVPVDNGCRPDIQFLPEDSHISLPSEKYLINNNPVNFVDRDIYDPRWTKKWFLNLSSSPIPEDVVDLLKLGPNFSLPLMDSKRDTVFSFIKECENNIRKYDLPLRERVRMTLAPTLDNYISNNASRDTLTIIFYIK